MRNKIYLLPENVLHTIDTEDKKSRSISALDSSIIGQKLVNLKNRKDIIVKSYKIHHTNLDDHDIMLMTLGLNSGHEFNYLNQDFYVKSTKAPREGELQNTFIKMYDMMIKYDDTKIDNIFKDSDLFKIPSDTEEIDIQHYYPAILYSLFVNSISDLTRHGTKDLLIAIESEDKVVHNNSFNIINLLNKILDDDFINGYKKSKVENENIYDFTINEKVRDFVNIYMEEHGLIDLLPTFGHTNTHPLYSLLFRNNRKMLFNLLYNSIGSELSRLGNSENTLYDNQITIKNQKYLQAAAKLLLYCGKTNYVKDDSIIIGNMKEDEFKIINLTSQDYMGEYYEIELENDLEEDNGILVDGVYIR